MNMAESASSDAALTCRRVQGGPGWRVRVPAVQDWQPGLPSLYSRFPNARDDAGSAPRGFQDGLKAPD